MQRGKSASLWLRHGHDGIILRCSVYDLPRGQLLRRRRGSKCEYVAMLCAARACLRQLPVNVAVFTTVPCSRVYLQPRLR